MGAWVPILPVDQGELQAIRQQRVPHLKTWRSMKDLMIWFVFVCRAVQVVCVFFSQFGQKWGVNVKRNLEQPSHNNISSFPSLSLSSISSLFSLNFSIFSLNLAPRIT